MTETTEAEEWAEFFDQWPEVDERHQEGQRKTEDCGCELIWSRGKWHPTLTCWPHATAEMAHWEEVAEP